MDFNDYILPMPNLEEGFEAFWVDEKNIAYTDILGNGVLVILVCAHTLHLSFISLIKFGIKFKLDMSHNCLVLT